MRGAGARARKLLHWLNSLPLVECLFVETLEELRFGGVLVAIARRLGSPRSEHAEPEEETAITTTKTSMATDATAVRRRLQEVVAFAAGAALTEDGDALYVVHDPACAERLADGDVGTIVAVLLVLKRAWEVQQREEQARAFERAAEAHEALARRVGDAVSDASMMARGGSSLVKCVDHAKKHDIVGATAGGERLRRAVPRDAPRDPTTKIRRQPDNNVDQLAPEPAKGPIFVADDGLHVYTMIDPRVKTSEPKGPIWRPVRASEEDHLEAPTDETLRGLLTWFATMGVAVPTSKFESRDTLQGAICPRRCAAWLGDGVALCQVAAAIAYHRGGVAIRHKIERCRGVAPSIVAFFPRGATRHPARLAQKRQNLLFARELFIESHVLTTSMEHYEPDRFAMCFLEQTPSLWSILTGVQNEWKRRCGRRQTRSTIVKKRTVIELTDEWLRIRHFPVPTNASLMEDEFRNGLALRKLLILVTNINPMQSCEQEPATVRTVSEARITITRTLEQLHQHPKSPLPLCYVSAEAIDAILTGDVQCLYGVLWHIRQLDPLIATDRRYTGLDKLTDPNNECDENQRRSQNVVDGNDISYDIPGDELVSCDASNRDGIRTDRWSTRWEEDMSIVDIQPIQPVDTVAHVGARFQSVENNEIIPCPIETIFQAQSGSLTDNQPSEVCNISAPEDDLPESKPTTQLDHQHTQRPNDVDNAELEIKDDQPVRFSNDMISQVTSWLRSLGLRPRKLEEQLEDPTAALSEFQSGVLLCELVERLEHMRTIEGVCRKEHPSRASARHNITKALALLGRKMTIPRHLLRRVDEIMSGNRAIIVSLLLHIRKVQLQIAFIPRFDRLIGVVQAYGHHLRRPTPRRRITLALCTQDDKSKLHQAHSLPAKHFSGMSATMSAPCGECDSARPDPSDSYHHLGDRGSMKSHLEPQSVRQQRRSILDTIFFTRGNPIYQISKKRSLDFGDLLDLNEEDATSRCFALFKAAYDRRGGSLVQAMMFTYGRKFAFCGFGQLCVAAAGVFAPIVLHHVVEAFGADHLDLHSLSIWLTLFFISRILTVFVSTQVAYGTNQIAIRLTAAMKSLLFRKAMTRDRNHKRYVTASTKPAEIANLISSDTDAVLYAVLALHNAWILPLQIIIVTYLLYSVLDIAAFAGIAVVVVSLGVNYLVARMMGGAYSKLMAVKDMRMKTVKEVFGAIQIVKFNAWESRFHKMLMDHRGQELRHLRAYSYASATSAFVLWSSPLFVSTISFAVYALVLDKTLTAAKVFTAMALFNALRDPLRDLPATIQSLIQSHVSLKRLMTYLNSADVDQTNVLKSNSIGMISVENGNFAWGDTVVLRNITCRIDRGDFVVVYGSVGSGKSSFVSSLLGEMKKSEGVVTLGGRVAYYSQQPWIQNMTIRENILFGLPFDESRYHAVLDACCLYPDLDELPAGDETEIGEKGVNLSGGQKARISLARACYSDSDIFLLDSPLAAVDAVVQRRIFQRCLCRLLYDKTVVLVTHSTEIVQSNVVNHRIKIENGEFVENTRLPRVPNRQFAFGDGDTFEVCDGYHLADSANCRPHDGKLVQKEARQEGYVTKDVWSKYVRAIGGWQLVTLLVTTQLLWQGFQIGSDVWLSHWTGGSSSLEFVSKDRVVYFTNIYSALACAGAAMVLIRGMLVALMGLRASSFLYTTMTEGLLHAPLRFFDANPIGRLINRYADDIASVDLIIPISCSSFLNTFFSTVCALITAAIAIKYVGLCVLPIIYLYIRIAQGYVRTFCDVRRMLKVVNSPILSHITQSEQGVSILRAFGHSCVDRAIEENHRRIDVDNALWDTEIVMVQWFSLRMQFLGCAIVIIVVGTILVFHDWFSPGLVGLAFTYALSIDASLMTLMKSWSKAENSMVSVERVLEYSDLPRDGAGSSLVQVEPSPSWPSGGEILFENVWFAYKPKAAPVLKGLTINIRSHERIGVVGRTGAGKSSLIMALFRMNELDLGRILVDGVDITTVPLEILRSRMAIIPQSPVLLEGSLRHFLDPFGDYMDDEILRTLQFVNLIEALEASATDKMERGSVLDTHLSANGENFSVGQRQMMCMARALLRKCAIVIMDEATASMDHHTEETLSQMIQNELRNVTLITIAHRLTTIMESDRILVLDAGRVVEFDQPKVLLENQDSAFSKLVRAANVGKAEALFEADKEPNH